LLHCVAVGHDIIFSEVYSSSIFKLDICRLVNFCVSVCMYVYMTFCCLKRNYGRGIVWIYFIDYKYGIL
jgi:hypothetical protein